MSSPSKNAFVTLAALLVGAVREFIYTITITIDSVVLYVQRRRLQSFLKARLDALDASSNKCDTDQGVKKTCHPDMPPIVARYLKSHVPQQFVEANPVRYGMDVEAYIFHNTHSHVNHPYPPQPMAPAATCPDPPPARPRWHRCSCKGMV